MPTRSRRITKLLVASLAAAIVFGADSISAWAAAPPSSPRPLAVSVPTEPTSALPGAIATVKIRVANPGIDAVTVTIAGAAPELGDNGQVTVKSGQDPLWQGQVDYPKVPSTIPPLGYIEKSLTIRMPAQIDPDLYFIGFVVTPTPTGQGNIQVVNQIVSFVTLDVPGPRVRELAAAIDGSGFVFGTKFDATVDVHNTGKAAARFWAESNTTASPGDDASHQQRIEKLLLPKGRSRSFSVSGKPNWFGGVVTVKVRVTYNDQTDTSTREIVLTKRVVVVNPIGLAVAIILIGLAVVLLLRRRSRNRRRRETQRARWRHLKA